MFTAEACISCASRGCFISHFGLPSLSLIEGGCSVLTNGICSLLFCWMRCLSMRPAIRVRGASFPVLGIPFVRLLSQSDLNMYTQFNVSILSGYGESASPLQMRTDPHVCDIQLSLTTTWFGECVCLLPRSVPPLPKLAISLCREGCI